MAIRSKRFGPLVAAALIPAVLLPAVAAHAGVRDAETDIAGKVDAYLQSIDAGDAAQGATLFHNSPDTVFIHPRGTERGWPTIEKNIYGFFRDTFSARKLRRVGALHVKRYGKSAIVEFEWDFVATFRHDQSPLNTKGRETQVFHKFPKLGWRIIHVHYSGLPVTGAREGF